MDDKKFSYTESEGEAPPTEVIPRAKRRRFSASYKLRILEEADAATASGEVGALLRREGLYSSHLTQWCRQREQGTLLGSTQIGKELLAKVEENRKLRQEISKTRSELKKAKVIIEVQKQISMLIGESSEVEDEKIGSR
ncbi:MAG: transposase [Bacteroidota bacterium]|nr:transposase [Bacteroidota bacterium]